jgi:D-alanyl-D-alanine dipeptidase
MPKKIIFIADPEIVAMPVEDKGEALVDLRDQDVLQYGKPPVVGSAECYTKIRKTVYDKLCLAQNHLPNDWRFRIYEGYRSLEVQQALFDAEYQRASERHLQASHEDVFHETTQLVAPVMNLDGSQNIPPHSTGAAVDLEVITPQGKLVDMGMSVKDWNIVEPEVCFTVTTAIPKIAREHRKILAAAMKTQGFVNYATEWWHYSYGDQYWAYHRKIKKALYGSVKNS